MDTLMILEAGKNQYFYIWMLFTDALGRLHPIHHGHDDIHQDQIGPDLFTELDGFRSIRGLAHEGNIRYSDQHPGDDIMDMSMVVHNENTNESFCIHICII